MFDTGCCGANLKQEKIHLLGVLLIAYPLLWLNILLTPLFLVFYPLGRFFKRLCTLNLKLWTINLNLMEKATVAPKLKCQVSSYFYDLSPSFSGLVFKNFNFFVLSIFWLVGLSLIYFVWSMNHVF